VLGGGGSRRGAEQAAAKRALEQAQALMPATVRKPRKSTARAAAPPEPAPVDGAHPGADQDAPALPAPVENRRRVQAA
jgi:hypothetical protein